MFHWEEIILFCALVQFHDIVKIVELCHSPSNMACQKELLSKSGAVHNQGLSAFTTKSGSSMSIQCKSGLHLACRLQNQLRGISDVNRHLASSHCRKFFKKVWRNWFNAIGECLSAGFAEHWDWACYWWCLFHPFFENYGSERSELQFNHYVFCLSAVPCLGAVFFLFLVPVSSGICILEAWDLF